MGNNCIVTIPSKELRDFNSIGCEDLRRAQFTFDTSFHLQLADGQTFISEKVVRLIPKRRMVVFGLWQGRAAVAKLFFDTSHAKRHMEKDIAGIKLLQENKIPTPALYYQGKSEDHSIHVLIFERIFDAKNLEEIWSEKESIDDLLPLLQSVIIELATQHVLGVLQHDLHLKNFLLTEKTIYTLDGGQIDIFPRLLPKKLSMSCLALFLSQFGVGVEAYQEKLFRYYAKARGWLLKNEDLIEMFLLIKKWNEERWQRFEKKIFRECTNFARIHHAKAYGMYDRSYAHPEFINFLSNPDAAFTRPDAKMLKAGRSATVIKITLDQREFVIKRYNLKNPWHRLRRSIRSTRAATSWRLAQKLNLFGVLTAKPVAFVEKRFYGLRGKSYYVTEYVAGENAGEFFGHRKHAGDKVLDMIRRITALLKGVAKLEITQGDLKATNILINAHGQPVLIDLDGAAEHASLSSLRSAWKKEIKRFLQNFQDHPSILAKFKDELEMK